MTRPAQLPGHLDQPRLRCCKLLTPARLACQSVQYPSSMTVPVRIAKGASPQTGKVLAGIGLAAFLHHWKMQGTFSASLSFRLHCSVAPLTASDRQSTCCAAPGPPGLESAGLLALQLVGSAINAAPPVCAM